MKKINFIILSLLVAGTMASCKKFLTTTPKTQMPQDLLFSNEGGFKDALTGVYIQMKSNDSYGMSLTQTTVEQLIANWDVTSNSTEQRIGLFNFGDAGVQARFSAIWAQEYKTIASINAILGQIDQKKTVFVTPGLYEMIKSECLALRAYCHLDILRLFGPVPTDPSSAITLPYATELSRTPQAHISIEDFKANLFKDLQDAENLAKDKDPILNYSLYQLRNPGLTSGFNPDDNFFAYRYLRMNYYAIKALQARAYLWSGDNAKAYECAKIVIDAKDSNGNAKFNLGTASDMSLSTKNYVLTGEHIFGLYAFDMFDTYSNTYTTGILKKGSTETTIKNTLYGNTGTDIRESNMWELLTLPNSSKVYVIKKYQCDANPAINSDYKQIPMLRLSEMYLIAAEAAPYTEGVEYFKTFRTARNIGNMPVPANTVALQAEIIKEYRKEFYAEGQAFFAYKRINAPKASIIFSPAAAVVNYVVPIPTGETI